MRKRSSQDEAVETEEFVRLIMRLAVAVMKSDGSVVPKEIEALRHLDRLGLGRISDLVLEEMQRAAREPIDLAETCARIKATAPRGGEVILAALATIASSDQDVPVRELWSLRQIARHLALPEDIANDALDPALQLYRAQERLQSPRTEVASRHEPIFACEGASREQILAAYRAILERNDPITAFAIAPELGASAVRHLAVATMAFEAALAALDEDRSAPDLASHAASSGTAGS
jgi:uncharacterized tellurite resistance protein B-like protein